MTAVHQFPAGPDQDPPCYPFAMSRIEEPTRTWRCPWLDSN